MSGNALCQMKTHVLFNRNRSGRLLFGLIELGNRHIQDAVVVACLDVVDVGIFGQRKRSFEAGEAELFAVVLLVLGFAAAFLFRGDFQHAFFHMDVEVVLAKSWGCHFDAEAVAVFGDVHCRGGCPVTVVQEIFPKKRI